jgi:drug/metabolite transporter (DMT)-like permease
MVLLACGISTLAVKDGFGKVLVLSGHHPVFLLWFQFATTWIFLAPAVAYRHGATAVIPKPFWMQSLRGFLIMAVMVLFFVSLKYIQLAEAHAMVLIGPVVATALSPLFLAESVGWRRWIAVLVSFIGVLIVLRPELTGVGTGYFIALAAGFGVGCYFIANRLVAGAVPPLAGVLHSVAVGTFFLLPFMIWIAPEFHGQHWPVYLLFAVLGLIGQTMLIVAFDHGEASLIAPFHYAVIIASILFGYIAFGQLPQPIAFVGIFIIVASGLYVAIREARSGG